MANPVNQKTLIIGGWVDIQSSAFARPGSLLRGIIPAFFEAGMARSATIFKAELQVADLDRSHFGDYSLTIARHPSETDERMMIRLLAFALNASETLAFGRGLSTEDEADLQDLDATGAIERWIDVGLPDEKDIRRACNRSRQVVVLSYGARAAEVWWQQTTGKVAGQKNLTVLLLPAEESQALGRLAQRTMRLQCTIQDGIVWLGGDEGHVELKPVVLQAPEQN